MLSIDALKELGVNTEDGLKRCMNNESFYFRLIGMGLKDQNFGRLKEAVEAGDMKAAFEAAHALKGVLANLSLTNISDPVSEITELLRAKADMDYKPLMEKIMAEQEKLTALLD